MVIRKPVPETCIEDTLTIVRAHLHRRPMKHGRGARDDPAPAVARD